MISASLQVRNLTFVAITIGDFDRPLHDLAKWRVIQAGFAKAYGSDSCVKNPSRLMRIAGTVSYPSPGKKVKGYEIERTELRIGTV